MLQRPNPRQDEIADTELEKRPRGQRAQFAGLANQTFCEFLSRKGPFSGMHERAPFWLANFLVRALFTPSAFSLLCNTREKAGGNGTFGHRQRLTHGLV